MNKKTAFTVVAKQLPKKALTEGFNATNARVAVRFLKEGSDYVLQLFGSNTPKASRPMPSLPNNTAAP